MCLKASVCGSEFQNLALQFYFRLTAFLMFFLGLHYLLIHFFSFFNLLLIVIVNAALLSQKQRLYFVHHVGQSMQTLTVGHAQLIQLYSLSKLSK